MRTSSLDGLSAAVAEWAAGVRFEDLPERTVKAAKTRLLDALAVTWAGSSAEGIRPIRDLLLDQGGRADSTVLAFGDRLPVGAAAMLNGAMGGALDFDGLHDGCGIHTDIVVLPAALALAEKRDADGKELLTALCIGEELLIRLGLSTGTGPGWFFSSIFGVIAAAVSAGKILGLDADGINAAMGVAFCHASGSQQNLVENRLTKRFQTGFAAQAGVLAAEMAAVGVGGPLQSLEGKFGVNTLFAPLDPAVILENLGNVFYLDDLTIKKYPSCFCNHAAIQAALELAEQYDLQSGDIESIAATVPSYSEKLVGGPFNAAEATQATAQFSLPYSIACALRRRRFTLADIEAEAIRDPETAALADKVSVEADPDNKSRFVPIDISIQTRSGKVLNAHVAKLPGTPDRPLSEKELLAKAEQCFALGIRPLTRAQIEGLVEDVRAAERLTHVGRLTAPRQEPDPAIPAMTSG